MAGRERRVGRGRTAACALVLALSVSIAGGVYLTASPGDTASNAGLPPQRAVTGDATHAPEATAPGEAGVGEATTVSAAPGQLSPDAPGSAPMGTVGTTGTMDNTGGTGTDVPMQVYGGEESAVADQETGYIVSQNDPTAPQTSTTRGLNVRVTSPQTTLDETGSTNSSSSQSADANEVTNDSTGDPNAQDGTGSQDSIGQGASTYANDEDRPAYGTANDAPASQAATYAATYVEQPISPSLTEGVDYASGTVLININEGMSANQVADSLASAGVQSIDPSSVNLLTEGIAQVNVTAGNSVEDALTEISRSDADAVVAAQPDFIYHIDMEYNEQDLIEKLLLDDLTSLGPDYDADDPMLGTQQEQTSGRDESVNATETTDTTDAAAVDAVSQDSTGNESQAMQSEGVTPDGAYLTTESEQTEPNALTTTEAANYTAGSGLTENDAALSTGQDSTAPATADGVVETSQASETTQQGAQQAQVEVEGEPTQMATTQAGDANEKSNPVQLPEIPMTGSIVDDPYYIQQWNIDSINADDAWADGYMAERNSGNVVTVAVLDNGFDVNHEDLAANIIEPYNAVSDSWSTDVRNEAFTDSSKINHGMHVLGIISAATNNAKGVAGITYNARIMPILVSDQYGNSSTSVIVKAYTRIMALRDTYNVRVVNMSLGLKVDELTTDNNLYEYIDKAFDMGIVTVCSAGNKSPGEEPYINMPADYAPIVSVINLTNSGFTGNVYNPANINPANVVRSDRSNYNRPGTGEMNKDIAAPGTNILSAYKEKTNLLNYGSVPYGFMNGTSMAAPHVSSVLALMFSYGNYAKNATGAQQAVDTLFSTARHLNGTGFDSQTGFGEVDALAAVSASTGSGAVIYGPSFVGVGGDDVSYSGGSGSISSSDNGILSVSASGSASAIKAGQVMLSANSARKTVTVVGPIEGPDFLDPGETATYSMAGDALRWDWSVSNRNLATLDIDSNGVLTLTAKNGTGKVTLTATLVTPNPGGEQLRLTKEVQVGKAHTTSVRLLAGKTSDLATKLSDTATTDLTWRSDKESVATVDAAGVVTGRGDGTANVTATRDGITVLTAEVTVDANIAKMDGKNYVFTVSQPKDVKYTGSAFTPDVTVTHTKSNTRLAKDTDYRVSYSNNVNYGTARVTITGISPFTGTRSVEFKIVADDISENGKVDQVADQTYTGQEVKPTLKVTLNGTALRAGTDYEVRYASNVNAGTASYTVTAKGNYTGTLSGTFKINPADASKATVTGVSDRDYTGKPVTQTPAVKLDGTTLVAGKDYDVSYSDNITGPGEASVTVSFKGNYRGQAITKPYAITANLADAVIDPIEDQVLEAGKEITPEPVVTLFGKRLSEGDDYTLDYDGLTDRPGTSTITVRGIEDNHVKGTRRVTFRVVAGSIVTGDVSAVDDQTYTGDEIEPALTVTHNGTKLTEGTDYDVTYTGNVNVGEASYTVTGKGDYTGTVKGTFMILPADASGAKVSVTGSFTYRGSEITPTVSVTLDGKAISADDGYDVTYANNTNAGTATVHVYFDNNYEGAASADFTISPADINDASVSAIGEQSYTGSAVEPKPTVTFGGRTLVAGTDYTLSYTDQVSPGRATVTIQGINNFTGTRSQSFEIVNPITRAEVTLPAVVDYTGEAVTPKPTVVVDGRTLKEGEDYVLVYSNNVNQGIATLTIQGIGEFEGTSKTVTFEIKELSQEGWSDNSNGQRFFVRNNCVATGWQYINNNVYWLGYNGLMQTGVYNNIVCNNSMRYYFSPSGTLFRVRWSDPYDTYYATPYGNRLWMGSNGICYRMNYNNGLMVPAYQYNPLYRYGRLFNNGLMTTPYETMGYVWRSIWENPYRAR